MNVVKQVQNFFFKLTVETKLISGASHLKVHLFFHNAENYFFFVVSLLIVVIVTLYF